MNIAIYTATGHYNLGDELILKQEYDFLNMKFPDSKFFVFTYDENSSLLDKNENIKYISYFPKNIRKHPLKNLKYLWQNIKITFMSDIVIIGGGGLIYKDEIQKSSSPIMQWKFRVFLAKLFKKKIVWLAVGISYPKNELNDIKYLFSGKNTHVSVRDRQSKEILNDVGINAVLLKDPVFMLKAIKKAVSDNKTIGISLRRGYIVDEQENIKQLVLYLSRKGYNLVFLSHSIHQDDILADDSDFLLDFASTYRIPITKTIEETLLSYEKIDMMIGMRLHSMILSIINNIPFVAISYGQKTQELLKDFEYDYVLNPKKFNFEDFIHTFERLEKSNKEAKFALNDKYDRMKKDILLEYNSFIDGFQQT